MKMDKDYKFLHNLFKTTKTRTFIIKELLKFLLLHGSYIEYLNNITRDFTEDTLFDPRAEEQLLNYCFTWEQTPQGRNYWSNRNALWVHLYSNLIEEYKNKRCLPIQ